MATNWANRQKAAVDSVPLSKPAPAQVGGKRNWGTPTAGVIEKIEGQISKASGNFMLRVAYGIGNKYPTYDYIVLRKMNAEGNFEVNPTGENRFKKFLHAAGLSAEQILEFPIPKSVKDEKSLEALSTLNGTEVCVFLVDEEYMGKVRPKVTIVTPISDSPLAG